MADRLGDAGARPNKQPTYAPIFVAASLTGLYSQRHVFHDPSNVVTQRFYGGRPDTLWDGLNVELSNQLTIIRRFGCSQFSSVTYPQAPTCAFSFEKTDGTIQVLIDTPSFVYVDNQNGTKTTIITKSAGAGQGYFVASGNTVYYGDGVDTLKYTPGNPNGIVWNWGIAAPIAPPSVTVVPSGSSAVSWEASTFYSTMGLLVDSNNNIQFLVSVTQSGNTGQIGETGVGLPAFSNVTGGTTTDNTVTWKCKGQIGLWVAGKTWAVYQPVYDQASNGIYVAFFGGTSGNIPPRFVPTFNTHTTDSGGVVWQYIGPPALWQPSTTYNSFWEFSNQAICEPILPTAANLSNPTQAIYVQTCNDATVGHTNNPGTSGSSYSPVWQTTPGLQTADNQLLWTCLGSKTWAGNTPYAGWAPGSSSFSALVDGNGNFQVCVRTGTSQATTPYNGWKESTSFVHNAIIAVQNPASATGYTAFQNQGSTGSSGSSEPTWDYVTGHTTSDSGVTWTSLGPTTAGVPVWGLNYGSTTNDGGAAWVNCGTAVNSTWATNTEWFLPAPGFAPPLSSNPYGGASVIGSAYVQFVTASGLSNSTPPSWPTTVGSTVTDNQITWTTTAAQSAQSITWTKSHVYAYSFKARTPTDPYVTSSLLTFNSLNPIGNLASLGNVPGLVAPLGAYLGSGTGGVSTASPVFTISTPDTSGAVNVMSGLGSTDPQVDTIVIWRDADGGGAGNMFELIEIPAPAPVGGNAQPWTFNDFLPDIPKSVGGINYPGLDNLSPAPIADANDPPPAGFLPLADQLHFARIWGAVGNTVFHSSGPDVIVGNPNEAFNGADDDFPFESTVITCIHTPSGLICGTTTDFECIYGGPSTASFYDTTMLPGVGILSWNAWDIFGGEIYFLSSDSQGWVINPATQLARVGFPIGDKLAAFNATNAYLTVYEFGTDNALYIGDGSTQWYRMNPHQVGADVSGENVSVWSPRAVITGGVQMLQAIETAPGIKKLLIGGTGTNQHILKRDTTVFADNGTAYEAWMDIGAITLTFPGQRAAIKFIECDFSGVGTQPTVSYVLDDPTPSPTWNALTLNAYDPPIAYAGLAIAPTNLFPDRFYLSQNQSVGVCRRVRIKVDFGNSDVVKNELISFCVFGRKYVEQ